MADALGVDRSELNSILYAERGRTFNQTPGFCWRLATPGSGRQAAPATPVNTTPLARLCRYYLACLAKDMDRNVSEFAASKYGDPNYAELSAFPFVAGAPADVWRNEGVNRVLSKLRLERRKLSLILGYPTRLSFVRAKSGWEGFFVEPVLLFELDVNHSSQAPELLDERPEVNIRTLRSLTGQSGPDLLDEVILLRQELGLDGEGFSASDYEEMFEALRQVRPDWPWREPLDPNHVSPRPPLSAIGQEGIFNRVIVLTAERSPYTQGLETELRELVKLPPKGVSPTALGHWLDERCASPVPSAGTVPVIEVLPLNSEQRTAVECALERPLTVITGPPGTGKSQVVTSIIVNCAWRGQRVLFASRNHKAVDVVEARVNAIGPRPVLLRLGTNEIQARLAEYLASLLAATVLPHEHEDYRDAQARHQALLTSREQLEADLNQVIELRNHVDTLEQEVEPFRELFPVGCWEELPDIDLRAISAKVEVAEPCVLRAVRSRQGIFTRLFWGLVCRERIEHARAACATLCQASAGIGLPSPPAIAPTGDAQHLAEYVLNARERIKTAGRVQQYFGALRTLVSAASPETVTRRMLDLEEDLARASETIWSLWLRLQPARLTREQRVLLGDYKALLETITQAHATNEKLGAQVYRRFYELFPKLTNVLPAWAVTNLSARGRIPLEPGFFDLLIVDEASQCDIASVLPLLYRCKRAAIIGDPKQLRHITQVAPQVNQQLMRDHDLSELGERWSYTANSLFDLAASLTESGNVISLRDHHRSRAEIIEFSNAHFYEGRLRVATRESELRVPAGAPAVRWAHVAGSVRRPSTGGAVNREEAQAVVRELARLLVEQRYAGSVGVVSPFRAQANLIRDLVNQDDRLLRALGQSELLIETVYKFQGDERDVMIFSPVVSKDTPATAIGFLRANPNTFNVAITRGRAALVVVGDHHACRVSEVEHLAAFAEYVERSERERVPSGPVPSDNGPDYPAVAHPERVSEWERLFYRELYRAGLRPLPQYMVERYALDLALIVGGRRLDIEVDGERYHRSWNGDLALRDQLRSRRLIELGWDVMRFWVYQIRDALPDCVRRVQEWYESAREVDCGGMAARPGSWRVSLDDGRPQAADPDRVGKG